MFSNISMPSWASYAGVSGMAILICGVDSMGTATGSIENPEVRPSVGSEFSDILDLMTDFSPRNLIMTAS